MSKKRRNHRAARAGTSFAVSRRAADGRVYLALHRDGAGNEHVTFSAPVFGVPWLDEVALGAVNTTLGVFGEKPSFALAAALAERAMAATSRLGESLLQRAEPGAVACRAGCDHCCHQSVGVTPPEALAIVAHLKQTFSPEALATFGGPLAERPQNRDAFVTLLETEMRRLVEGTHFPEWE